MQECHLCDTIAGKRKGWKVYEDEKIAAFLSEAPASPGHIVIVPREHYPILESTPDYVISHAFNVANKMSIALFEALGAEGTNIIVNNGTAAGQQFAHLIIHVIARRQGDGLNFQWQPRQLTEEQMSTVELMLKEQTKNIGNFEKEKQKPVEIEKKPIIISAQPRATMQGTATASERKSDKDGTEKGVEKESAEEVPASEKGTASEDENYLVKQLRKVP